MQRTSARISAFVRTLRRDSIAEISKSGDERIGRRNTHARWERSPQLEAHGQTTIRGKQDVESGAQPHTSYDATSM